MGSRRNTPCEGSEPAEHNETGRDGVDDHYGLRIEADRSSTVHHVFTGVPADIGGQAMTGLGRAAAADSMISMNLRGARRERIGLDAPRLHAEEIEVLGWR